MHMGIHLMRILWGLAAWRLACLGTAAAVETMNVGFLWHMHQPIYYPGKTINQTDAQCGCGVGAVSSSKVINPERRRPQCRSPRQIGLCS